MKRWKAVPSRPSATTAKTKPKPARVHKIVDLLSAHYSEAKCSLNFTNPLQLLIATMLSAQCTDERVNKVTPVLFEKYETAKDFARAKQEDVEAIIRSTGFFRNKAKNITACCQKLVADHHGEVPRTMEELSVLPGVGRKTANVVLGNAFGIPGVVVDTHVFRLSRRMGLASGKNPVEVEQELERIIDRKNWTDLSHWFIAHGRTVCTARSPKCDECFLAKFCPKIM